MRERTTHARGAVRHHAARHGLRDYAFATADDLCHRPTQHFSVGVSPAGIEPVGFRTKSDLRNHQAIIQPLAVPAWPKARLGAGGTLLPTIHDWVSRGGWIKQLASGHRDRAANVTVTLADGRLQAAQLS